MSGSRFVLIQQPVAAPGVCFICKSAANGPFVDTMVSIKWEGAIIVCAACIIDMHNQLPAKPEPDVVMTEAKAFQAGYQKATLAAREDLNERLAGFIDSDTASHFTLFEPTGV